MREIVDRAIARAVDCRIGPVGIEAEIAAPERIGAAAGFDFAIEYAVEHGELAERLMHEEGVMRGAPAPLGHVATVSGIKFAKRIG